MNNRTGPAAIDLDHRAIGDLQPAEPANEAPMGHHHQAVPIGAAMCFFEKSTGARGDHGVIFMIVRPPLLINEEKS